LHNIIIFTALLKHCLHYKAFTVLKEFV